MQDPALDFGALCWPLSTAALCLDELRLRPSRAMRRATGAKPESPLISVDQTARITSRTRICASRPTARERRSKRRRAPRKEHAKSRNEPAMSFRISKGFDGHRGFRRLELADGQVGRTASADGRRFRRARRGAQREDLFPAGSCGRELCKKVFQKEAKTSFGINKSLEK